MKLREIIDYLFDKVVIYETITPGEYCDLYRGEPSRIPNNLLELNVGTIGAKRKGILDIEIRR